MRPAILLISILFLLAACDPMQTVPATLVPTATLTIPAPTLHLPSSATPLPTQTPAPPTVTPLPTIPTFTPTFDVRTIVTVTPAAKAECPKEDSAIEIDIPNTGNDLDASMKLANKLGDLILDWLNKGLKVSSLLIELKNKNFQYLYEDFNDDGVKDILLRSLGRIHIFYCDGDRYKTFTEDRLSAADFTAYVSVMDLNKNGLPEILLANAVGGKRGWTGYIIEEWNGKNFMDVALNPATQEDPGISGPQKVEFKDANQNGLKDLVFSGEGPWDEDPLSRVKTVAYTWNGKYYAETYISFAIRQYRFQAIQDADRELHYGDNQKALSFYQEAIFSNKLEWWSHERQGYVIDTYASQYEPTPTFYPTPVPDLTEYPRLAAYAYYRMVILYTHLGEMDAAQTEYTTLQEKFPSGSPGHPYVEMASNFWNAYQSTGKMYNACAAAIAFADAHPEILTPLGSDYHGWQSHIYTPADVCPFR